MSLLQESEAARWHKFHRSVDRERYLAVHALLRHVLGRQLGLAPEDLRFAHSCVTCGSSEHGKPYSLDDPSAEFSLSHSGNRVVVALSDRPVGVDVELVAEPLDVAAEVLNAAELSWLERCQDAERATVFTLFWACKEAALKATGHGLAVSPKRLAVHIRAGAPPRLEWPSGLGTPGPLALVSLTPDAQHVGAVALHGTTTTTAIEHDGSKLLHG